MHGDHSATAAPAGELPGTVRAFVVARSGEGSGAAVETGVRTLGLADLPGDPVTVQVHWSSVNYKDAMTTQPGNRVARSSPLVPGVDLVGTVLASEAPTVAVGSPVIVHGYDLGVAHHGGFAELARVPAAWVVPLPKGLSARHAAAVGTAGFTAALSLDRLELLGVRPRRGPLLVTGASGGVGSMAVLLASARGYEVVASTGKRKEHGYLRSLGAAEVVGRDEVARGDGRTLGPERWGAAIDCVGGTTLAAVLRTLRYGGAVAASGLTGGSALETTVYPFIVRHASLLGIDTVATPLDERVRIWQRIADEFPREALDRVVEREVGLDDLGPVLRTILEGGVRGRVLVVPGR